MLTIPTTELALDDLDNLLKCKFNAYYALGKGSAVEIPTMFTEAVALYSGAGAVFLSLGELDDDPVSVKYSYETKDLNSGKRRVKRAVSAEIKGVAMYKTVIDMLSSDELKGEISILLVPFKNPSLEEIGDVYPAQFVLLNGVRVRHSGEGNANDELGNFVITATAKPKTIGSVLNLLTFSG